MASTYENHSKLEDRRRNPMQDPPPRYERSDYGPSRRSADRRNPYNDGYPQHSRNFYHSDSGRMDDRRRDNRMERGRERFYEDNIIKGKSNAPNSYENATNGSQGTHSQNSSEKEAIKSADSRPKFEIVDNRKNAKETAQPKQDIKSSSRIIIEDNRISSRPPPISENGRREREGYEMAHREGFDSRRSYEHGAPIRDKYEPSRREIRRKDDYDLMRRDDYGYRRYESSHRDDYLYGRYDGPRRDDYGPGSRRDDYDIMRRGDFSPRERMYDDSPRERGFSRRERDFDDIRRDRIYEDGRRDRSYDDLRRDRGYDDGRRYRGYDDRRSPRSDDDYRRSITTDDSLIFDEVIPSKIKAPLDVIKPVTIPQVRINNNFSNKESSRMTYLYVTSSEYIDDSIFSKVMSSHGYIEREAKLSYTSFFIEYSNEVMAYHGYNFAISQHNVNPRFKKCKIELKNADFVQELIKQRINDIGTTYEVPRLLILHNCHAKDLDSIMKSFEDVGLKEYHRDGKNILTYHKSLASVKDFYQAFNDRCAGQRSTYVTESFNTEKIKDEVFNIIRQKLITECLQDCNQMLIPDLYVHTLKKIKFFNDVVSKPANINKLKQKTGKLINFELSGNTVEFRLTQVNNILGKVKKASKERKYKQLKKSPKKYTESVKEQMNEIVDKIESIRQPDLEGPCARLSPIRSIKESRKREYLRPYARARLHPLVVARDSDLKIRQSQWTTPRPINGKRVYFEKSVIQGYGLFAAEPISQDSLICEYNGELIRSRLADLREKQYEAKGFPHMFLFRIDQDLVVDATMRGGISRFLNHSCHPNCRSTINKVGNNQIIAFYAEKNIKPHEEICFNYKMEFEDRAKREKCYCGAKQCLGYLNYCADPEVRRQKEIEALEALEALDEQDDDADL